MTKDKREKPLSLDMNFAEAFERFAGVELSELPDSMKLSEKGKMRKRGAEAPRSASPGDAPPTSGDDDATKP